MRFSIRRQTQIHKNRAARDDRERGRRLKAVEALQDGSSGAHAVCMSGVCWTTCNRLKQVMERDEGKLKKLLDPFNNRTGRRTVVKSARTTSSKCRSALLQSAVLPST
eukprot:IDg15704t1